MSEKEAKTAPTKKLNVATLIGNEEALHKLDATELGGQLKGLSYSEADEITSEYLKIEEGQEARGFFVGMEKIKKIDGEDGETTDAARFLLEDGSFAINADVVVVSTARTLRLMQPVAIQCRGWKGEKTRQYRDMKVFKLS